MKPILEAVGVSKYYGAFKALENVSLKFFEDEIVKIIPQENKFLNKMGPIPKSLSFHSSGKVKFLAFLSGLPHKPFKL